MTPTKMPSITRALALTAIAGVLSLAGCATKAPPYDYTAYRQHMPASILVLPPTSQSPDINASSSLWSHATMPLAESGYYVIPVALVAETLRENGIQTPAEAQALAPQKLQSIFGADAGLYIDVTQFGTQFLVLNSVTSVAANARLVDLKTGTQLWTGSARAQDGGSNSQGSLAVMLVTAVLKQITNTATDMGHRVAGVTSSTLLQAGQPRGLLWGARAVGHGKDTVQP